MDEVRMVLVIVVVALTVLLLVVGVQVVLIIRDLRRALKRLNTILDDAIIGGGMISPGKLTGILQMFRRKKKVEDYGPGGGEFREEL